ncbi:TolC family protein [Geomonas paludis]|uniref:TolC family protein n=1 Tax=Geomonas paludis TaxID=2740185 RepID=A0A6V8MRL2_9BACT|nr:TolC family protein [Geomonas paludis]UPU35666.1 TolC family protein [Geomonas paludis]GFO62755.1 transporter [Geomonas paludis]
MIAKTLKVFTVSLLLALAGREAFAQDSPPLVLSLDQAITRGLKTNLSAVLARSRMDEAEGTRERRLAAYLPHLRIETPFAWQTRNLRAQGISFPNSPAVVGPFTSYDFRIYGEQSVLDLQSYHAIKAAEEEQKARRADYQDARGEVIRLVTVQYLNAAYAQARVATARSRVQTSEVLEKLARDQRAAGVADGLDVLRAQVQLANDRQNLLATGNNAQLALLALARSVGIDLGTPITLTDQLSFKPLDPPQIEQGIQAALESRPDYRSLFAQRASLEEQAKASRSRYLPKIVVSGNYGTSGQEMSNLDPTGMLQVNMVLNLFDYDRKGERLELESRLDRNRRQIADLKLGVEQDIRAALLNLTSATDQVATAREGAQLAERELQYAGDRFRNGIANNIEVVTAQDALARARDNELNALAQHAEAKITLARALGDTEQVYRLFLGIE